MEGILVIAHGSRAKNTKEVFFRAVEGLKESEKNKKIDGCFMEISEPFIPETVSKMYSEGVRNLTVLPYFLFSGIHIKEDIPKILSEMKEIHEGLNIKLAKPIEYDEKLVELLKKRLEGESICI